MSINPADHEQIVTQLEASFELPPGDAKERAITELALDAITSGILRYQPTAASFTLDWSEDGMTIIGLTDAAGHQLEIPESDDVDLWLHASNIREHTASSRLQPQRGADGPFDVAINQQK